MEKIPETLVYFDTGVLSKFESALVTPSFRIAFSDAHIRDLKNSSMPEKELQFLKDSNAYFITKDGMNTVVNHRNPFEVFRNTDDNSGQTMGSMLSFFSGGGPDQTAQASLISILEKLTASVPLVAQLIPTLPPMEVTNRDIEQGIDKSLQTIDQTMSLRDTLALAPPNYTKEIFKLIPDKNP
ncbi:MAG: hypothetical protein ACJAR9_002109, partial [Celeribacter sp.]